MLNELFAKIMAQVGRDWEILHREHEWETKDSRYQPRPKLAQAAFGTEFHVFNLHDVAFQVILNTGYHPLIAAATVDLHNLVQRNWARGFPHRVAFAELEPPHGETISTLLRGVYVSEDGTLAVAMEISREHMRWRWELSVRVASQRPEGRS